MPFELAEARLLGALCQRWGYTPEQAREAPVWVLRMTAVLEEGADKKEEAAS